MLRFLATGDLQIHPWKQFATTLPNGMNSRLANCLKVFDILQEEGKKRGISKILLNGDILEESDSIQVEVYDATYRRLERLHRDGFSIAINLGNHDIASRSSKRVLHTLRPFRKVAKVIEFPQVLWDRIFIIPNQEKPEETAEQISVFARKSRIVRPNCLILHEGVRGARVGPSDYQLAGKIRLSDLRPKKFDLILLSDFHTQQFLRKNVLYMGSPLQHSFGETHNPCIWDVTLLEEPPYFKLRKVPTAFPKFIRVEITEKKLQELSREIRQKENPLRGNYVRFIIRSAKVKDEQLERFARDGSFLFQIERKGLGENGARRPDVSTLDARELISKYVDSRMNGTRGKRLVNLGIKIYEGQS